jgi:hypothetical protein
MKRFLSLVILLVTLRAGASEQSYGPIRWPNVGRDHAVAVSADRVLLVWNDLDSANNLPRIRYVLLDHRARPVSAIFTIPVFGSGRREDFSPTVASDGSIFLLTYVETTDFVRKELNGIIVDSAGNATARRTYATPPADWTAVNVLWAGTSFHVGGIGVSPFRVARDGALISEPPLRADTLAINPHTGQTANASRVLPLPWSPPTCLRQCAFQWTAGNVGSGRVVTPAAALPPVAAVAGNRFVLAWSNPDGAPYIIAGVGENFFYETADAGEQRGLDCDDADCVLAYSTPRGDVHAITFPFDALVPPIPITIAETTEREHLPQVDALGDGRFLVSYPSGAMLKTKLITLTTPKRRAARF